MCRIEPLIGPIAAFSLLLALFGCAAPDPHVRSSYHSGMVTSEMSLVLAPLWNLKIENNDELSLHYKKEIRRVGGGSEVDLVGRLFCESMTKYVDNVRFSCADSVRLSLEDIRDTMIAATERDYGSWTGVRRFYIPKPSLLEKLGVRPEFVLLVGEPTFSPHHVPSDKDRRSASQEGVQLEFSYCIWDFMSERMVAYGVVQRVSLSPVDYRALRLGTRHPGAKLNWKRVLDKSSVAILNETPFEGPKARGYYRFPGPGFW